MVFMPGKPRSGSPGTRTCLAPGPRARIKYSTAAQAAREPAMAPLCPVAAGLLLGPARAACDPALLGHHRVTLCINVSRQQPFPGLPHLRCIRVPVFDDPAEDLYRHFDRCGEAIEAAVRGGGTCLVYCKNGRSRSAAVCTAYLMRHRKLTLKEAFATVKAARPEAEPNAGFWAQLQRYEEELQMQRQSAEQRT
ncbi:dual specificity phosphatase 28 isoform X2 [Dromaius novaehollandiae]|uniref:dual specificity phosphatase 28 isoform X2 n=1 Tax=Dromaius novaehollandiae TaxID=8790 RepID=UPI0031203AE3